jgi:hypothetical protein
MSTESKPIKLHFRKFENPDLIDIDIEIPLIIGFKYLLDKFGLYLNFRKNIAYLEC